MTTQTHTVIETTYANAPFVGQPTSVVALSDMSGPDLLGLFNLVTERMGGKRVNKFADKQTAVKRTWAALEAHTNYMAKLAEEESDVETQTETQTTAKAQAKAAKQAEKEAAAQAKAEEKARKAAEREAAKAAKPPVERKKRGRRFVFPALSVIKTAREGSKRALAIRLLTREEGAKFEDIQAATGWNDKDAYEGIRLVHYYVGYGMAQDEDGTIRIFTDNKTKTPVVVK